LQSQGTLVSGLGDALAWVPLRQGRLNDALRVQAWMDAYVATEQVVRTHVARRLREQFAHETKGAAPPGNGPLDEASALHLVLQGNAAP
jgi:hypothetical protein